MNISTNAAMADRGPTSIYPICGSSWCIFMRKKKITGKEQLFLMQSHVSGALAKLAFDIKWRGSWLLRFKELDVSPAVFSKEALIPILVTLLG